MFYGSFSRRLAVQFGGLAGLLALPVLAAVWLVRKLRTRKQQATR